jgi:septum site-determining protein MinD
MKKIIVITSGKGGVGKTTTAINLALAIKKLGKEALVIDGNLSTPNIGIHLNSPEVPINLNHVLQNKAHPHEAVYEHESGLKIIPSSLSIKELKRLKPERLKNFKKDFLELSDYIIFDSAAGLGIETMSALELADEIIIVTNPEMPAITDALKTLKVAEELNKPIKGIIITRVKKVKSELEPEVVKEMLDAPILGMIPEDKLIQYSLKEKHPILHCYPRSKPSRAYKEIAARILEVYYDSRRERPSFWRRVRGKNY